jgi:alkyldihydroxyacetonephosphate synthase
VGCRITQLYHEGVCVYVYVCVSLRGVDEPEQKFSSLEQAARSEILACGGSISHHHGVGKIRIPFLSQVDDQSSLALSRKLKMAMDPTNVFGARNGRFADT